MTTEREVVSIWISEGKYNDDMLLHHDGTVATTQATPPKAHVNPASANSEQLGQAKNYNLTGKRYFQEQNFTRAFAYFKQAAELGSPEAQRFTGLLLFQGKGCAKDRKLAGQWLRKAASQGDPEAQKILKNFGRLFRE